MALIKVLTSMGMNMNKLNPGDVFRAKSFDTGASLIRIAYSDTEADHFYGKGLTYDAGGMPSGGSLTEYKYKLNGKFRFSIKGTYSVLTFMQKAITGQMSTLVSDLLSGRDRLLGNTGKDFLKGFAGRDFLRGNKGADTLLGGSHADSFYYGAANEGRDIIKDFSSSQGDKIKLKKKNFHNLSLGAVAAKNFRSNYLGVAKDGNDFFIFSTKTKTLYYDRDGNGSAGRIKIATFSNGARLSRSDLVIVQ